MPIILGTFVKGQPDAQIMLNDNFAAVSEAFDELDTGGGEPEERLIPDGGTKGQSLVKSSGSDYDAGWASIGVAKPFSISSNLWAASTAYPDYPFQATIPVPGAVAGNGCRVDAYFDRTSRISALEAQVDDLGDTGNNTATFYAVTQPDISLTGLYTLHVSEV